MTAMSDSLHRLCAQALLSYRGLFLWLNWPGYISNVVFRPVLAVVMFGLTGRFARGDEAAEAFAIGVAVYGVANLTMGAVLQGFYYERAFATLGFLFASSGSRLQNFASRGLLHWPNAVLSVVASLFAARFLVGIDFGGANWDVVALGFLLVSSTMVPFALFLGNFCIPVRDWQAAFGISQIAFLALTGAVIPRDELPSTLRLLGGLLPTTHGLEAIRAGFDGAGLASVRGDLLSEAAVGLAYAVAGYVTFCVFEAYTRRSGAYELT
jgi:ABC-2 type transport system permease protein